MSKNSDSKVVTFAMNRFFRHHLDHVLFWILTAGFHAYTRRDLLDNGNVLAFASEIVVRNVLLAAVIYFTLWFVIAKINDGRIFIGTLACLAAIVFYVFAKSVQDVYLYNEMILGTVRKPLMHTAFYNLSIVLFYLAFATALYLSRQWYVQREILRQVRLEKLHTELEYLKAQMNPHFLFNSINTIFFQIDKSNHVARETLGKFSDMLRYQLYECNDSQIAIEKELAYLKSYVELQRLRRNENNRIAFSVADNVRGFSIPPMLLIPFIENAFKHASNYTDRENEVLIMLTRKDSGIRLQVKNTIAQISPESNGIGLKNVRRRLQLLFPDSHMLDIKKTSDMYEVNLTLQIA